MLLYYLGYHQYINNGSINKFRVFGADDIMKLLTWVDASYIVHRDMKSHTQGVISFGIGAVLCKSLKQK